MKSRLRYHLQPEQFTGNKLTSGILDQTQSSTPIWPITTKCREQHACIQKRADLGHRSFQAAPAGDFILQLTARKHFAAFSHKTGSQSDQLPAQLAFWFKPLRSTGNTNRSPPDSSFAQTSSVFERCFHRLEQPKPASVFRRIFSTGVTSSSIAPPASPSSIARSGPPPTSHSSGHSRCSRWRAGRSGGRRVPRHRAWSDPGGRPSG